MISAALIGGVLLWALQELLISFGQPAVLPPVTGGVALVLLGVSILALARHIRRHVAAHSVSAVIDPLFATRVVLLAKSSTVAGSALSGAAVGLGIFFLARPVIAPESLWLTGVALLGAIVLATSGFIAERWCTVPPGGGERDTVATVEGEPG